jgi:hypothetical protein
VGRPRNITPSVSQALVLMKSNKMSKPITENWLMMRGFNDVSEFIKGYMEWKDSNNIGLMFTWLEYL